MRGLAWLLGVLGVSDYLTHCSLNVCGKELVIGDLQNKLVGPLLCLQEDLIPF